MKLTKMYRIFFDFITPFNNKTLTTQKRHNGRGNSSPIRLPITITKVDRCIKNYE
jgi:hypothetical protein